MDPSWLAACPPGVSLARRGADAEVSGPAGRVLLRDVAPVWDALARLPAPGGRGGRLIGAARAGPAGTVARLTWCLVELARAGFLRFAVAGEGRALATAVPMTGSFTPERT